MNRLRERLAFIKGLTTGLAVDHNSPEGRVLVELLDLMDDMVHTVDSLHIGQENLEEYVSAIDEDLTDLENDFYDEDEDDLEGYEQGAADVLDDIEYVEVECPNCQETVFVDLDVFNDEDVVEVLCPECQTTIFVNDDTPVTLD